MRVLRSRIPSVFAWRGAERVGEKSGGASQVAEIPLEHRLAPAVSVKKTDEAAQVFQRKDRARRRIQSEQHGQRRGPELLDELSKVRLSTLVDFLQDGAVGRWQMDSFDLAREDSTASCVYAEEVILVRSKNQRARHIAQQSIQNGLGDLLPAGPRKGNHRGSGRRRRRFELRQVLGDIVRRLGNLLILLGNRVVLQPEARRGIGALRPFRSGDRRTPHGDRASWIRGARWRNRSRRWRFFHGSSRGSFQESLLRSHLLDRF